MDQEKWYTVIDVSSQASHPCMPVIYAHDTYSEEALQRSQIVRVDHDGTVEVDERLMDQDEALEAIKSLARRCAILEETVSRLAMTIGERHHFCDINYERRASFRSRPA